MGDEIWFHSDGGRLFAIARGRGAPVILLHGGLANHLACEPYAAPLAARFRVVTPDLRGSGRSTVPAGTELTWDRLADDIAALLRHLGLTRAVIGGVSFGSGVALRVALRHPEIVAGLVLIHPAYGGSDVGLTPAQRDAMAAMDAAGQRCLALGPRALHPLFDPLPEAIRVRARAMADGFDPVSVAASTAFMASGAQPMATAADLAAIAAPTLLVPGVDVYHPPELGELYRRHLPCAAVHAVDTPQIGDAIAAFIDGVKPALHHAGP